MDAKQRADKFVDELVASDPERWGAFLDFQRRFDLVLATEALIEEALADEATRTADVQDELDDRTEELAETKKALDKLYAERTAKGGASA